MSVGDCILTHWRPIPIHYRDQSLLHCRPIPIVYRDQFYIFFLFRTIPDTVSGLGFSVCYLLLSFHSKFRSGGVHSFYFTKLLRNPTQLDKLLLTISKMAEDTPKDRGKLLENFSQDLDLENEESDYSEMSDSNDPQYERGSSDVDCDIDLDDNDQARPTYLKISIKPPKHTIFENSLKKKYS